MTSLHTHPCVCSAIANQESLSGLETEMRKLEGVVKEVVDELDYLKAREERFQSTNSAYRDFVVTNQWHTEMLLSPFQCQRTCECRASRGSLSSPSSGWGCGRFSTCGRSSSGNTSSTETSWIGAMYRVLLMGAAVPSMLPFE